MILNSAEVMKRSSANNDEKEDDFISTLPDALLTQILSLLPAADACRTSVLSKRWKDLWMFLPNIHVVIPNYFTCEEANEYYDLVDKTLAIRDGMPIQRFFLHCFKKCDFMRYIYWLHIVVNCKVQILELRFPREEYSWLSFNFFKTCNTLVELTLEGSFLSVAKDDIFFPCLKIINLLSVKFSKDESFENLITSYPVLEELFLERESSSSWKIKLKVSSTSLKRLSIYTTMDDVYISDKFVIDAPKLEYLYIDDKKEFGYSDYSFTKNPFSLVEAYIDTNSRSIDQIVTHISAARVLTLSFSTNTSFNEVDEFDEVDHSDFPIFHNLVKLVIDIRDIRNWSLMLVLLHNMPQLDHITFLNKLPSTDTSWDPPLEARACLPFRVKEIILLNRETVTQEELGFIKFLLEHSGNLEKFTMNVRKLRSKRSEKLLKCYCGSNRCQIELVPSL